MLKSWLILIMQCKVSLFINFLFIYDIYFNFLPQMLEDMKGLLQAAEEKRQASIAELSAKHQKVYLAFRCLKHGPFHMRHCCVSFPVEHS